MRHFVVDAVVQGSPGNFAVVQGSPGKQNALRAAEILEILAVVQGSPGKNTYLSSYRTFILIESINTEVYIRREWEHPGLLDYPGLPFNFNRLRAFSPWTRLDYGGFWAQVVQDRQPHIQSYNY